MLIAEEMRTGEKKNLGQPECAKCTNLQNPQSKYRDHLQLNSDVLEPREEEENTSIKVGYASGVDKSCVLRCDKNEGGNVENESWRQREYTEEQTQRWRLHTHTHTHARARARARAQRERERDRQTEGKRQRDRERERNRVSTWFLMAA